MIYLHLCSFIWACAWHSANLRIGSKKEKCHFGSCQLEKLKKLCRTKTKFCYVEKIISKKESNRSTICAQNGQLCTAKYQVRIESGLQRPHSLLAGNVQSGIHRSGHSSGDDDILQWAVTGVSCHIGNLVYHLHSRNDLRETILTFFLKTVYKNLPFRRRSVYCPDEAEWQERWKTEIH